MNTHLNYLAALTALAACATTYAAETRTTMSVAMTVPVSCTISATAMSFGTNTGVTSVQSQSAINVNCPTSLPYNVAIDAGANLLGDDRRMRNGSAGFVSYRLTKTRGGANWGDSDFGNTFTRGSSVAGTGAGSQQTLLVFGETVGAASIPAGSYTDSVVVTVHY